MPVITLPDGSRRDFPKPVTVVEIAASIGTGLARAALAGRVNGKLVDTSFMVDHDAQVTIVTDRDPEGIEIIRHSTAHLLAQAVKELFPEAQVTIGPVIENGFYYDFSYKRPFTPEDLIAIEKRMAALAAKDEPITRKVLPRDAAVAKRLKVITVTGWAQMPRCLTVTEANDNTSIMLLGDTSLDPLPEPLELAALNLRCGNAAY